MSAGRCSSGGGGKKTASGSNSWPISVLLAPPSGVLAWQAVKTWRKRNGLQQRHSATSRG